MWRSAERGESPASFTVEPIPVPDPGAPGQMLARAEPLAPLASASQA
jgi:hypothetical protein